MYDQWAVPGVRCLFQDTHGGLAARVVGILGVVGPGQQHLARAHEAAEIIHVPVRFIVEQAMRQPDHLVDRQVVGQHAFDFFAAQVGVAVSIEQAFLGGDQRAFAVDMNRAAFKHEAFGAVAIATLDF